MKYEAVASAIFNLWSDGHTKTAVCLLGPPGIGKTSVGDTLVEMMRMHRSGAGLETQPVLEVRDLTSSNPEDFPGLPFRASEDGTADRSFTDFAPLRWFTRLCEPGAYGVLMLDDLPAASTSVQVAVRQLVLFRTINGRKISDGVFIIVTGNRRSDKSAASELPAHFRNSVVMLTLDPDFEDWSRWYSADDRRAKSVVSFLMYRPSYFTTTPDKADPANGSFATPRTWSMLGSMMSSLPDSGVVLEIACGLVGSAAAQEFVAYIRNREDISIEDVFENPQKAIPQPKAYFNERVDRQSAICSGLTEIAVAKWKKVEADEDARNAVMIKYLKALNYLYSDRADFLGVACSLLVIFGSSAQDLGAAVIDLKKKHAKNGSSETAQALEECSSIIKRMLELSKISHGA